MIKNTIFKHDIADLEDRPSQDLIPNKNSESP